MALHSEALIDIQKAVLDIQKALLKIQDQVPELKNITIGHAPAVTYSEPSAKIYDSSGPANPEYIIKFGKFKDQKLKDIKTSELQNYVNYIAGQKSNPVTGAFLKVARAYLDGVK